MASRRASSAALSSVANQMLKSLGLEEVDPELVFEIQNKEGAGAFGRVFRAYYKGDPSRLAALKVIPVALEAGQRGEDIENVRKEILFLRECDHPNVVAFYGAYYKDGALWLAMEYCGGGSVGDVSRQRRLEEHEIAVIMRGALHGLAYLHSKKKIHRDIKGGNILLTASGQVKIADFGVSAQLRDTMSRRGTFVGTPYWMSPEMIQDSDYDYKSDIWSLGITAIELADQKPPLFDEHPMRVLIQIPRNPSPQLKDPRAWSPGFSQFLQFCLQKDPLERPTALECLEHAFIRGVERIERVSSGVGAHQARSAAVVSAPEPTPLSGNIAAGAEDAAQDLTVASSQAREVVVEARTAGAGGIVAGCDESVEPSQRGAITNSSEDDIAEDISRLDDESESGSDNGDEHKASSGEVSKTDDISKTDDGRGAEAESSSEDDDASSDSDSSCSADETFNFRQPGEARSGESVAMMSSDELLELSVSESVELSAQLKSQTLQRPPPVTAAVASPAQSHAHSAASPPQIAPASSSQPPTEFKLLLLPSASKSPLAKSRQHAGERFATSANNFSIGSNLDASSDSRASAEASSLAPEPQIKREKQRTSSRQQSVVTTTPKQLSSVSSSWQNPLADVHASSRARVNVLLSSMNSLSSLSMSSSTRLFTKLLQDEVENQKPDQSDHHQTISSSAQTNSAQSNSSASRIAAPRAVQNMDDMTHRRSLQSASVAGLPPASAHHRPRNSLSGSTHFIGGPLRVTHDVCVKFNSVDARFEGVTASEEWAVLHQQFGIPLAQMRCRSSSSNSNDSSSKVPALLHMLRRELLKREGLAAKFIYRASPEQNEVQSVKKAINSGSIEHSRVSDPHVYASLLKQWFRDLPSPLLSALSFDDIASIGAIGNEGGSSKLTHMLTKLPRQERAVLEWLLDHMLEVVDKSAVNKMTAQSLAVVMAPNLFSCESVSKTLAGSSHAANSVAEFLCALLAWRQATGGSFLTRSLSFAARSATDASQAEEASVQGNSVRSECPSDFASAPSAELSLPDRQAHSTSGESMEEMIKRTIDSIWRDLRAQGVDSVETLLAEKRLLSEQHESYQRSLLELIADSSKRSADRDWAAAVLTKLENGINVQNLATPRSLSHMKRWVEAALSIDDFVRQLRSERTVCDKLERLRNRFPMQCCTRSSSNGGGRALDPEKTYDLFHQISQASLMDTKSTPAARGNQDPAEEDEHRKEQDASHTLLLQGALRLLRFSAETDNQSELSLRAEELAECGKREPAVGNILAGLSHSARFADRGLGETQEQFATSIQSAVRAHQRL